MAPKRTETVSGQVIITTGTTSAITAYGMALNPNFTAVTSGTGQTVNIYGSSKLNNMSDLFQYYRFKRVALKLLGYRVGQDDYGFSIAGYYPGNVQTAPTDGDGVLGAPWSSDPVFYQNQTDGANVNAFETVPSVPKLRSIPAKLLLDQPIKWWRTKVSANVDDTLEYQGQLYFAPGMQATHTVYWHLEYTIEFKDFVAINQTPLYRSVDESKSDCEIVSIVSDRAPKRAEAARRREIPSRFEKSNPQ